MSRKKKQKEELKEVLIDNVAAEGNAIGHVDGKVVFVQHAIPGDVVNIQLTKCREKYMEGYVTKIVKPSEDRIEPFCEHYGECGGCKWQELPYPLQLKYKQQQVVDQITRLGKVSKEEFEIVPILGSEYDREYRNKLEFSFSDHKWLLEGENPEEFFDAPIELDPSDFPQGVFPRHLKNGYSRANSNPAGFALGFHINGAFDKILDIRRCHLQPEPSNSIRNFIREYAISNNLQFFNIRETTGFLRNIIIRTNLKGEVMLTIMFGSNPANLGYLRNSSFDPSRTEEYAEKLYDALMERFPQIKSLNYIWNDRLNDAINDQPVLNARGEDAIYEEMEGLRFKIGPKSFYQTNPRQAYHLYSVVREFANLKSTDSIYDLYTGTGTIALFLARGIKSVIGIEYVPEAINDANINAGINGIDNAVFYAGDMKDILTDEFVAEHGGTPDAIIADPPRAGMHPDVINVLLNTASPKIVYVSCNPATQARDIQMLGEKYRLVKIRPVDMFPHTHHIENVAILELR